MIKDFTSSCHGYVSEWLCYFRPFGYVNIETMLVIVTMAVICALGNVIFIVTDHDVTAVVSISDISRYDWYAFIL